MTCAVCSAPLSEGALFCGECGSATSAIPTVRRRLDARTHDTSVMDRAALRDYLASAHPGTAGSSDAPGTADIPARTADTSAALSPPAPAGAPNTGIVSVPVGDPVAPSEARTIGRLSGHYYRLDFSTGERRIVFGTGLIGRRPEPDSGEQVDHLIQIADYSASVSKTHLEFGEHESSLWIADRFSSNGTKIQRLSGEIITCEPGRRYLVQRGSRVELGSAHMMIG